MDQEIKKLEQLKQQEILLMQQIYEKKINYLNTKIQLLTDESKRKDQELENLKTCPSECQLELQAPQTYDTSAIKSKVDAEKEKEISNIKAQYQQELHSYHQQMKNRDLIIEQMKHEIKMFQNFTTQDLDNQKVTFLSQIIDVTNELLVQL